VARSVPAVVRALDVLELFLDGRTNLSAPEVANGLGLPRTTVHELLATLVEREYVERLPDNAHRFRLGLRVFELGNTYAEALDVVRDGQSVVDEVAARCGETCQLAVLDGRDVVYVAKADGSHDLRVQAPVGRRSTALRTAAGRVLLAHLPWGEMDRRFPVRPAPGARRPVGGDGARRPVGAERPRVGVAPARPVTALRALPGDTAPAGDSDPAREGAYPAFADSAVADAVAAENARLRRELAAISQRGVGSDPGGADAVVRSVAAAIRDHLGHVVAAVEISVPVARWDPQRYANLEQLVRRAAGRASARLGFRPPRVTEAMPAVAAAGRPRRPVTTSRLDPRALAGLDPVGRSRSPRPGLLNPGAARADDVRRSGGPLGANRGPAARPTDSRLGDPRLGDPRLGDPRLGDSRLGDSRLGDSRSAERRSTLGRIEQGGDEPARTDLARPHRSENEGVGAPTGVVEDRPGPRNFGPRDAVPRDLAARDLAPRDIAPRDRAQRDEADTPGRPDHPRLGFGRPGSGLRAALGGPRLRQLPTLPNPS